MTNEEMQEMTRLREERRVSESKRLDLKFAFTELLGIVKNCVLGVWWIIGVFWDRGPLVFCQHERIPRFCCRQHYLRAAKQISL